MKRILKFFLVLFVFVVLIIAMVFLYWEREQKINFTHLLPPKLQYCGNNITSEDIEHSELKSWFKSNQQGWRNTLVTYVPKTTYTGSGISVNILDNAVIVNYQNSLDMWNQVIKEKKNNELLNKCTKS